MMNFKTLVERLIVNKRIYENISNTAVQDNNLKYYIGRFFFKRSSLDESSKAYMKIVKSLYREKTFKMCYFSHVW